MIEKQNVLIFPSGAENAINIFDSLKYNIHFELFGATQKQDHSEFLYDKEHLSIGNYNIKDKLFFENFNELIKKFKINFIIPTHDEIAYFLMKNEKKINSIIICSPFETCDIALSKIKTYEMLQNKKYIANRYSTSEEIKYPAFAKPDIGSGGKGIRKLNDESDYDLLKNNNNYIITEFLPGIEITVDCFTNKQGELLYIGPRTRERITNGVSFRSEKIECEEEIKYIAKDLNNCLKFRGLWFFQLKKDKFDKYKLLEISIRAAGTMALYRQLGINFALLSLFDFMNFDLTILENKYNIILDRFYKSTYKIDYNYQNIYIDFDDTLIINDKVNGDLMKLIYQCKNLKKKIYLITKHERNIFKDLKKYNIEKNIFDQIYILKKEEKKSKYIKKESSILIDNYYRERLEVKNALDIPVFDVDMIESLIV